MTSSPGVYRLICYLQLHRQLAFLDLVVREHLQMARESKLLTHPDKPLRRVVLVPSDRIPVVHRELVVEIMVPFAYGDERGYQVVSRGMFVIERRVTEPVGKGVYAISRLRTANCFITCKNK